MFLSDDDLRELTGSPQKSKQAQWLRERHYVFELTASGHPRVLRSYAESRLGLRRSLPSMESATVPNFV